MRSQKLRLSVVYALLDRSPEIRPEHVAAAEVVWRYSVASLERIFGDARSDRVENRILRALRDHPDGVDRTALHSSSRATNGPSGSTPPAVRSSTPS